LCSYPIAAENWPALEDLLVSGFPPGIIDLERQPWINHHGQVGLVRKADADAVKIGICAELDFVDGTAPGLGELHQPGA